MIRKAGLLFGVAGLAVTALAAPARASARPGFGLYDAQVPQNAAYTKQIAGALPVTWVLEYESLFSGPWLATLRAIHGQGAMPILNVDPYIAPRFPGMDHPDPPATAIGVPVRLIAAGKFDSYLRWYADRLRSLRFRVGLSFAHEMNGDWYSWGSPPVARRALASQAMLPPNSPGRTPPRVFVEAWRHLHDVFVRQGARNVVWIWTVNRLLRCRGCPPPRATTRADWPGSRYVNWIGIDGYLSNPRLRFRDRLAPTVRFVRTFARKPILIQETGVWDGRTRWAQFRSLVQGVRRYRLLGWMYENRIGKLGQWTLTGREKQFLGRLLHQYGYRK